MPASLQGVPKGSLVHRFITSGKPGKCRLCPAFVEKLEAHHLSYSPEITIDLCHKCHHKVHFWPNRLTSAQKLIILRLRFSEKHAYELANQKTLGVAALAKLIAPSRSKFVRAQQMAEIKRIKKKKVKK